MIMPTSFQSFFFLYYAQLHCYLSCIIWGNEATSIVKCIQHVSLKLQQSSVIFKLKTYHINLEVWEVY